MSPTNVCAVCGTELILKRNAPYRRSVGGIPSPRVEYRDILYCPKANQAWHLAKKRQMDDEEEALEEVQRLNLRAAGRLKRRACGNPGKVRAPVEDIDYTFQPQSYFGPVDLKTRLLSTIKGEERRLRAELGTKLIGENVLTGDLAVSGLTENERKSRGALHPTFMGGEYLPDLRNAEVEIARVALSSVTLDVISTRARREDGGIAYVVMDEHETEYRCCPEWSRLPLTLAQLVRLIEQAGIVIGILETNRRGGADLDSLAHSVSVSSAFYPDLERHWEARVVAWVARCRGRQKKKSGSPDSGSGSPF